jgi:hypothetical protein
MDKGYFLSFEDQLMSRVERIEKAIKDISDCQHERSEIRYRLCSNGSRMYSYQCLRCGKQIGGWINKKEIEAIDAVKPIDDELKNSINELRTQLYKKKYEVQRETFFSDYDEYLKSDQWNNLREKVLKRCNRICEGCGNSRAVQVHHTTYKHYRREFLFELVGLCHTCHNAIHAKDDINAGFDA